MRWYYCELNKQGNDMAALFWDKTELVNNFKEILKDTYYNVFHIYPGCPEEEDSPAGLTATAETARSNGYADFWLVDYDGEGDWTLHDKEEEINWAYIYEHSGEYEGEDCFLFPEDYVKTFLNTPEGKKYPALDRLYKQTVRYRKHKNKKRAAEYKHMKDMLTPEAFDDWKKHSGF